MSDPIHERGKAIEDLFFAETDKKLLAKLRDEMAAKETRHALEVATGINDATVLDALIANSITPETLTTVGLIPLVVVAWADGVMEGSEKNAILQAADIAGIKMGTAGYEMLEKWLVKKPQAELLSGWAAYIKALKSKLEPAALTQLKSSILDRAEGVAKSAGGFLGLGSKISDSERDVLDDLAKSFE